MFFELEESYQCLGEGAKDIANASICGFAMFFSRLAPVDLIGEDAKDIKSGAV
jgi:hypothetical protein